MGCAGSKLSEDERAIKKGGFEGKFAVLKKDFDVSHTEVGSGASAAVSMCKVLKTGEVGACKAMRLYEPIDREDFLHEVDMMKIIGVHHNIVAMLGHAQDPRYGYIVLSGCTGGELFDRIASDTATEGDAATAVLDVLSALKFLHEKRIMHRDLKPENLMYKDKQPGSPIKVIDFGIAAQLQTAQKSLPDVVGTTAYMAPEVLKERGGLLCDMWSLGVIAHFVLSGTQPFPGRSDEEMERGILKGEVKMLSKRWSDVSADAQSFVKALLVSADKRLSAAKAMEHPWILNRTAHAEKLGGDVAKALKQHAEANRFQKAVRHQIATNLTGPELHQLRNLFEKMDTDRSGTLTLAELEKGLGTASDLPVGGLASFDMDGDGIVDYREFMGGALQDHALASEENLESVFKKLDTDKNGTLSAKEIASTLSGDEALAREILSSVGDGDQVMTLAEFKEHMTAKAPVGKKARKAQGRKATEAAAEGDPTVQRL